MYADSDEEFPDLREYLFPPSRSGLSGEDARYYPSHGRHGLDEASFAGAHFEQPDSYQISAYDGCELDGSSTEGECS